MASNRNLLVLPGDGIGPEVMNEVRKIIAWMGKKRAVGFDIKEDVVGGAALDKHGVPLTDDAMKTALEADAVLFGSVGGPKWDNCRVQQEARARAAAPAQGDGPVRQPAPGQGVRRADRCQLAQARDRQGPRHHDHPRADRRRLFRRAARHRPRCANGERRGVRHPALHDAARSAASAPSPSSWRASARTRCCSSEKANVMHTGVLWREEATKLHKEKYPDVELEPHVCRRARHAAAALAQPVRRDRHRQPVRRHPVRRGLDADRLARHAALGLARRARCDRPAQGALRADPRQRARHRRQGPGQSAGRDALATP